MKLILLAAGKSSRIFTKIKTNKCLIKINNKTLIKHIIDNAKNSGIKNIDIVTGFKPYNIRKSLNDSSLNYIYNRKYNTTDMVFSSILALKNCKTDVIICYTDIYFNKNIFSDIIKHKSTNILVPHLKSWEKVWKKRKKEIFDDAETFVTDNQKKLILEIGNKINAKNYKNTKGQFMGIIYLPLNRIKDFIYSYKSYKKTKVQFTELLNYLILKKNKINTISYNSFWYEFDDIEDLITFNK
jgi:choline kinase